MCSRSRVNLGQVTVARACGDLLTPTECRRLLLPQPQEYTESRRNLELIAGMSGEDVYGFTHWGKQFKVPSGIWQLDKQVKVRGLVCYELISVSALSGSLKS